MLRATACVTVYFVIQSIDYILFIGMGLLHGTPNEMFSTFMSPGPLRSIYLLLNKATDIIVFISLHKELHKLSSLRNSLQGLLFGASLLSYCSMQYLFSIVLYGDYVSLQIASIISFFFLLCFMSVVIFALLSVTKLEKRRSDNEILQRTNEMMEQNYQRMHEDVHRTQGCSMIFTIIPQRFGNWRHKKRPMRSLIISIPCCPLPMKPSNSATAAAILSTP